MPSQLVLAAPVTSIIWLMALFSALMIALDEPAKASNYCVS